MSVTSVNLDAGVSKALAVCRKDNITNLEYKLRFDIPKIKDSTVKGYAEIIFKVKTRKDILLDFKERETSLKRISVNGKIIDFVLEKEHIIIKQKFIQDGLNKLEIEFNAPSQSLNRQDEYMYTLLVPDRARTLFPCFDQPDLKAVYSLSLEVPAEWSAVANGKQLSEIITKNDRKIVQFAQTEPIPTYLFSFVVGKLCKVSKMQRGREISIYHRETDQGKISQLDEISKQVYESLDWLEEYTGIKYPFTKYDLIILPGFQYGGMEHTGATLYSDKTMFLDKSATIEEQLDRSKLIAHETAHMWFGDYVTMKWFDDVWTKEVFANYFASAIVGPMYPQVNHKINFINTYFPSAYSEDRTLGSNPIQQNLDNLQNAGLVYGNIIYNKAPIVMDMLVRKIGEESFRKGIKEYLLKYAYSNASWDDLINILDNQTPENLLDWSNSWVKERGMPIIASEVETDNLLVKQYDSYKRDLIWNQSILYLKVEKGKRINFSDTIRVNINNKASSTKVGNSQTSMFIPNIDGLGYGYFKIDDNTSDLLLKTLSNLNQNDGNMDVFKISALITLNENVLNKNLNYKPFVEGLLGYATNETNTLLFSRALSQITNVTALFCKNISEVELIENRLWKIVEESGNTQHKTLAFRAFVDVARSKKATQTLYNIWLNPTSFKKVILSERDLIKLSFELSILQPDKYKEITNKQLSRIANPDRIREYRYILPSLSTDKKCRDSVFNSLLEENNREVEPWAATSLAYLTHYKREKESLEYILPGLEELTEVQQTGDIFFPRSWARSLLSGYRSAEASKLVDSFFVNKKDYSTMLKNKVLQQTHHLK